MAHKSQYQRVFLCGHDSRIQAQHSLFVEQHPNALILDENPYANISGYSSTVADEISMILEPLGISPAAMRARVETIAQQLHITDLLNKNPLALSGGQTQLVGFASLVVGEPHPLVLNSLLHGLDAHMRSRVLAVLADWQADILWTNPTQAFAEELELADEILIEQPHAEDLELPEFQWNIVAMKLTVKGLSISPESTYASARMSWLKRLFAPSRTSINPLVTDISFEMKPGTQCTLRGENGSGKTTLARTLTGLIRPLEGNVLIGQDDVHRLEPADRVAHIALVGQHPQHRILGSTLAKDLRLGPAADAPDALVQSLVGFFGLEQALADETHPHDLSLEEQTLVSIINAFMVQPSILVLDEPGAHLSSLNIERLQLVLARYLEAGGIIINISHQQHSQNQATQIISMADFRQA